MSKRKAFRFFKKFLTTTATLIVLGIFALTVFIIGLIYNLAILLAIGGAVGATVLSLYTTIVTSRESVQQQYTKEANIARKDQYYIPMFNELKQLQSRIEDSKQKSLPYSQWIKVSDNSNTVVQSYVWGRYPIPTFLNWTTFREQPYRSNFSPKACETFDNVQIASKNYNSVVYDAKDAVITIIAPQIDKAFRDWASIDIFKHWQQETQNGSIWSSHQYHDWNLHIYRYPQMPNSLENETHALVWANNLLGWILTNDIDKTSEAMQGIYKNDFHIFTLPSNEWFKGILANVWTELQNLPSVKEVSFSVKKLLTQTSQAQIYMQERLDYIQDTYEGGKPPL